MDYNNYSAHLPNTAGIFPQEVLAMICEELSHSGHKIELSIISALSKAAYGLSTPHLYKHMVFDKILTWENLLRPNGNISLQAFLKERESRLRHVREVTITVMPSSKCYFDLISSATTTTPFFPNATKVSIRPNILEKLNMWQNPENQDWRGRGSIKTFRKILTATELSILGRWSEPGPEEERPYRGFLGDGDLVNLLASGWNLKKFTWHRLAGEKSCPRRRAKNTFHFAERLSSSCNRIYYTESMEERVNELVAICNHTHLDSETSLTIVGAGIIWTNENLTGEEESENQQKVIELLSSILSETLDDPEYVKGLIGSISWELSGSQHNSGCSCYSRRR